MEVIFSTLLASIGLFLIIGIIIETIERYFNMRERFKNEV
tara:strand:+ start:304 stop:423 length:120 start_codon:yes stop_codon:yes gene_type:complete